MARYGGDDDGGERRKRSWSEIDKMRDRSSSRQHSQEQRSQERLERSPAYEQYKARVSKMFSGSEIPEAFREKLDPTGNLKARDEALKKIKKLAAEDMREWANAVTEYVGAHELPEDLWLLVEWLGHPKDRVVESVLAQLERLSEAGQLAGPKVPRSLDERLRGLELMGSDPDLQAKAKALREKLR